MHVQLLNFHFRFRLGLRHYYIHPVENAEHKLTTAAQTYRTLLSHPEREKYNSVQPYTLQSYTSGIGHNSSAARRTSEHCVMVLYSAKSIKDRPVSNIDLSFLAAKLGEVSDPNEGAASLFKNSWICSIHYVMHLCHHWSHRVIPSPVRQPFPFSLSG